MSILLPLRYRIAHFSQSRRIRHVRCHLQTFHLNELGSSSSSSSSFSLPLEKCNQSAITKLLSNTTLENPPPSIPNTKPKFFTLQKKNPLTALPIRRSANPKFATYAATSAAPMRRVAHPVCPSPALASSRSSGRTDGLETRPRGLVRGLLYDCVVKLRQRGHSTWLACWVVMTAYLWNSRFSSRPFCWRGKDTLVSLLVTTTPY